MKLITKAIRLMLLYNGHNAGADHAPVLKVFDPSGSATWLLSEMDPEADDWLFGLSDLGWGYPEMGTVRLSELERLRGALGLRMERDLYFKDRYPLSVYVRAAGRAGMITTAPKALAQAAADNEAEAQGRGEGAGACFWFGFG